MKSVQSMEKAVKLLEFFNPATPELSLVELTELSGFPKATTHRLALTLEKVGFLRQDKKTKKYRIGFKILELAHLANEPLEIRKIALPYMEELRDQTNEAVHLCVEEDFEGIYIEKVESHHDVRFWTRIGTRRPMHAGASRKVIMAYYDDAKIEEYIRKKGLTKITDKTITDPEILKADLQKIRAQGYCVVAGEQAASSIGIAAPIFNRGHQVIASLSIIAPVSRINDDIIPELVEKVVDCAKKVTREVSI